MSFGRLRRSTRAPSMSDINMTPLIDVMLVLLVIFMIAAPLMGASLKLELPVGEAAPPSETPHTLGIALDADGRLYLGEARVSPEQLAAQLAEAAAREPHTEVQLRADKRVPYGEVASLIAMVRAAGLSRIGFVTAPAASAPAR